MHQRRRRTLQGKLLVGIVTAVLGTGLATITAFGWTSTAIEQQRLSDVEHQVRETISTKAEALLVGHALALRVLIEDDAMGDVRQLIAHAAARDEDLVYGLYFSANGQHWAYVSPTHPDVHGDAPTLVGVLAELDLPAGGSAVQGVRRRTLHGFGQDLEEFRIDVAGKQGAPLGTLLYGFGSERARKAVAHAEERSHRALARAFSIAGAAGVAFLLLAIAWALRSAARLTAPVAELTANANAIAAGQRGVRAQIASGDELEVLAAAFNQMLVANEDALSKLEASTERALAADRLKSEFLANMSHEIRTPMNGVLGMSKLMLTLPLDSKLRRYVKVIDTSATSLLTIVNDVLDFSKMEAGKYTLVPTQFELASVLQDVLELLASRAHDKRIELVSRVDPALPATLIGDPDRLRQVLNNLVGNAIKFTECGEVFVEMSLVSRLADEAIVRVTVTDTGIGIDPADLPKLWEAFSQVDGSLTRGGGGTGLGLVISKRLVEMMGGAMQAQSEPGRGSTFTFTARFAVAREMRDGAPVLPKDLRVLLVEPHRRAAEVLLEALRSAGASAERSETGGRALIRLREEPPVAVVLVNRDAGDRPAAALAAAIRSEPGIEQPRLILMSAPGHQGEEPGAEFSAELAKPIRVSELFDRLRDDEAALGRRSSRAPAPARSERALPILVVDDNDINRFVVVEHLEQRGYLTEQAINGRDALEKCRANRYGCVLMDCQMPIMDGYAATRAIRTLEQESGRGRTPIIALTAHALAGERERVLDAGMDDFLSKPFRPSILDGVLRRCFDANGESKAGSRGMEGRHAPPPRPDSCSEDLDPDASRSDKLIRLFLDRMPQQLAELGSAVRAMDAAQIRALSHKIKGSALAVAAKRMSETAEAMQKQAEAGDLSPMPVDLQRLERQYGAVASLLEAELRRRGSFLESTS